LYAKTLYGDGSNITGIGVATSHSTLSNLTWSTASHTIDANIVPTASGTQDVGSVILAFDEGYFDTLEAGTSMYAATYYGDGSNLTNLNVSAVAHSTLSNLAWSVAGHTIDADIVPTASGTQSIGTQAISFDSGIFDNLALTDGKIKEYKTISIPITNPTDADDFLVYRFRYAVTIREINAVCMDGTSLTFKINECDGDGDNAAQICDSCTATVSNTTASLTNVSVDAGDYISYTSSAEVGDVTKMLIAIDYTVD